MTKPTTPATRFLHIHAIWPASGALLNADRKGKAKTIQYGGVTRLAVSSQAWKRSTRLEFEEALEPRLRGMRSRFYTLHAADELVNNPLPDEVPWTQEEATGACQAIHQILTGGEGNAMVFLADGAIKKCADIARELRLELAKATLPPELDDDATKAEKKAHTKAISDAEKAAKTLRRDKTILSLLNADGNVDIAFHGRMIASNANMNAQAAVNIAVAKSVEEYRPDTDDFTTVEEYPHSRDDRTASASGMIESRERGSGTLYRYAVVDLEQLAQNLPGTPWQRLVEYTIQWATAFLTTVPTASQTSTAANAWPTTVMVQPSTSSKGNLYERAFAKPVNRYDDNNDYNIAAAERIVRCYNETNNWFSSHGNAYALLPEGIKTDPAEAGITPVNTFDELLTAATNDLNNQPDND